MRPARVPNLLLIQDICTCPVQQAAVGRVFAQPYLLILGAHDSFSHPVQSGVVIRCVKAFR